MDIPSTAPAAFLLALALLCAGPGMAVAFWDPVAAACEGAALEGAGTAIDGDSLELVGPDGSRTVIHLLSLSAPELFQDCRDDSGTWSCGRQARSALQALLDGRMLSCTPCGPDGRGALEALCRDGETDINAEVVRSGFATTSAFFSNAMHSAEVEARLAGRGLWRGDWVQPGAWRNGVRLGQGPCRGCVLPP